MFKAFILVIISSLKLYGQQIDIQGHRGAGGMMPENTLPAFIYALDQGVSTLELDVVITKDRKVIVSHEPWMSPEICLDADNSSFRESRKYNIYQMSYEEVSAFDCGFTANPRLPEQQKEHISKPLLSDVIKQVEIYIKSYTQYEVNYNIEIKSTVSGEHKFHPPVEQYSDLVYNLVNQYLPMDRVIIQSFDFRVLRYWHRKYPGVRLSALIDNKKSIDTNLANLGFKPDIYSPSYELLSAQKIQNLHRRGIKVIPWTINEGDEILKFIAWGVDGIITDFPNKAKELGLTTQVKEVSQ